jgi:hypothetical protein
MSEVELLDGIEETENAPNSEYASADNCHELLQTLNH